MRDGLCKLISACLASLVLLAALGCGDKKSPPRNVDEKDAQQKKSPDSR